VPKPKRNHPTTRKPTKRATAGRPHKTPAPAVKDDLLDGDAEDRAFLTREAHDREMLRCENAWRAGSVPALVDGLILCHKERNPLPLWLARGAIGLIKKLFLGETLQRRGRLGKTTTRHRSYLIDYARWDAVRELADRRVEMLNSIKRLSPAELERRPEFAALEQDYTLDQRCKAVAELFDLVGNQAKGATDTILRSYKRVEHDLRRGKGGKYHLPDYQNPLRSTFSPR